MKNVFFICFILLNSSFFYQSLFAQEAKEAVVLTIAGEDIKLGEFEAIYKKNNNSESIDPKSVDEYLDLYINFKLKVKEATELGLDTLTKFRRELKGYREQLAKPYLSDKEVTEQLIQEAYDRMKTEIRASHILITVSSQAAPKDTLEAYNKIMKLRKSILDGASFEEVAVKNSNDPSVKDNKGDLGYFSALYMVYPFENAAYNTEVGKISMPVRTRYGYHLVKVTDKRPSRGEITVAHIMVKLGPDASEEEVENAQQKVEEIHQKIKDGEKFEELAIKFSDDKGSATKGGILPAFKAGRMVQEFEEAAFALKKDGEVSEPVRTAYGWHIIKRIEKKDLPPLEEIHVDLKDRISKDTRSHKSMESMLKKIKAEYGFKEKIEERNDFYAVIDSSYFKGNWDRKKAEGLDKVMFRLGKKEYTQQDFADFLNERQRQGQAVDVKSFVNSMYEDFVAVSAFDYEDSRLEEKYPEFRMLVQEYHDGILLFDLTDQKVWSKAVKDTSGLKAFYEKNKDKYKWNERLHAIIYSASAENIAKNTRSLVQKKNKEEAYTLEDLKKEINKDSQLNLTVEQGKFSKGDNKIIDDIKWEKGITQPKKQGDRYVFVEVIEELPPMHKELNEVRGLVTSDYQNHLEQEWIRELRAKYPVKVHKDVLSELN